MQIQLTVNRKEINEKVRQATGYTGAKMTTDASAYERISTTRADTDILTRYFEEARAEATQSLISLLSSDSLTPETYTLSLNVSVAFNTAHLPTMQQSLQAYFVHAILSRWYSITNKEETGQYADHATTLLQDVREKALYKQRPRRPTYT